MQKQRKDGKCRPLRHQVVVLLFTLFLMAVVLGTLRR